MWGQLKSLRDREKSVLQGTLCPRWDKRLVLSLPVPSSLVPFFSPFFPFFFVPQPPVFSWSPISEIQRWGAQSLEMSFKVLGNLFSLTKELGKRKGSRKQFNKWWPLLQPMAWEKQTETTVSSFLSHQRAGNKGFIHGQVMVSKKSNKDCRSLSRNKEI